MKQIQKEHRSGSVLDLCLILLALLCVTGAILRTHTIKQSQSNATLVPMILTCVMTAQDPLVADTLREGDALYTEAGEYYGSIRSVSRLPSRVLLLSGGEYRVVEWDGNLKCDLTLEISVEAIRTEHGYLLGGARSAVGSALPVLCTQKSVLRLVLYKMSRTEA